MKNIKFSRPLFLLAVFAFMISFTEHSSSQQKNVILYIGDGFGIAPKTALRYSMGQGRDGKRFSTDPNFRGLALDKLKYNATVTTHSLNSWITDSAPGASVYACGQKGKGDNEMIAIDATNQYTPIQTILEAAKKEGYAVGLVTTTRITHATPASFATHIWHRDLEDYIAAQYISSTEDEYEEIFNTSQNNTFKYNPARDWQLPVAKVGVEIDVLLGGGSRQFLSKSKPGDNNIVKDKNGEAILRNGSPILLGKGNRADSVDLIEIAKKRGYTYVNSRDALLGLDLSQFTSTNNKKLIGLFRDSHMSYELDRQMKFDTEPMLAEMTKIAIEVLKRKSPKGFFLLVEGGRIDHLEHANCGGIKYSSDSTSYIVTSDVLAYGDDTGYNGPKGSYTTPNVYGSDYMLNEVLAFDYSIEEGRKFMQSNNNSETLILSTSDHECGGFSVVGLHDEDDAQKNGSKVRTYAKTPAKTNNEFNPVPLGVVRGDVDATYSGWFPEYTMVNHQGYMWPKAVDKGRRLVISYGSNPNTNGNGIKIGSTPGNHTPQDILIYADDNQNGKYASLLTGRGLLDNTDLTPVMENILGVKLTTAVKDHDDDNQNLANNSNIGNIYPNPSNNEIYFDLKNLDQNNILNSTVKLEIFNSTGQRVKQLELVNNSSLISWNMVDDFGKRVPDGMYILMLNSNGSFKSQHFVVMK